MSTIDLECLLKEETNSALYREESPEDKSSKVT